jgi:hypothetical protein
MNGIENDERAPGEALLEPRPAASAAALVSRREPAVRDLALALDVVFRDSGKERDAVVGGGG